MGEETKNKDRKCFIITPIGNENSDIFRKAKGVIESVIKPVLEENGFGDIKPAYEIMESGMISNQIISRIVNDDLVIANLTGNNPNVMYELAIRHAAAKPIIHICETGTVLPFDIKDNRTIFYTDDMLGAQELAGDIERFIKEIDYDKKYKDNPIYNAVKMGILFDEMGSEGRQTEADILQKILNGISYLKTNIETKKYIKESIGIYEALIGLYDVEEEIASNLEDSFPDDISARMSFSKKNNEAILDITAKTDYYQERFLTLIEDKIRENGINHYSVLDISKIG